jgi:hypothetical protein
VKAFGAARHMTHLCQGFYSFTDVIKASGEGNNAVSPRVHLGQCFCWIFL